MVTPWDEQRWASQWSSSHEIGPGLLGHAQLGVICTAAAKPSCPTSSQDSPLHKWCLWFSRFGAAHSGTCGILVSISQRLFGYRRDLYLRFRRIFQRSEHHQRAARKGKTVLRTLHPFHSASSRCLWPGRLQGIHHTLHSNLSAPTLLAACQTECGLGLELSSEGFVFFSKIVRQMLVESSTWNYMNITKMLSFCWFSRILAD